MGRRSAYRLASAVVLITCVSTFVSTGGARADFACVREKLLEMRQHVTAAVAKARSYFVGKYMAQPRLVDHPFLGRDFSAFQVSETTAGRVGEFAAVRALSGARDHEFKLLSLDKNSLHQMQYRKEQFFYVRDSEGQLFLLESEIPGLNPSSPVFLRTTDDKNPLGMLVTEYGVMRSDLADGKIIRTSLYGLDHSPGTDAQLLKEIEKQSPGITISPVRGAFSGARYTDCLALLAGNQALSKASLATDLAMIAAADLAVSSIVIAYKESQEDDFFGDPKRNKIAAMDVASDLVLTASLNLYDNRLSAAGIMGVDKARKIFKTTLGLNLVSSGSYYYIFKDDEKNGGNEAAKTLAFEMAVYNNAYFMLKPVTYGAFANQVIWRTLPYYIFERCRSGENVSILMSPRMVRISDRLFSAFLYFMPRKWIFDN